MRFELTTLTLARLCSTPELRPLAPGVGNRRPLITHLGQICNLYRSRVRSVIYYPSPGSQAARAAPISPGESSWIKWPPSTVISVWLGQVRK